MAPRGRRVAVFVFVLGAVLLAAGGSLLSPRLVEEWYLSQLEASDPAVRLGAARKLAERRSVRAIPRLMDLIENEDRERADLSPNTSDGEPAWIRLTPIAYALYRIGPEGASDLDEAVVAAQSASEDGLKLGPAVKFVTSLLEPANAGPGLASGQNLTFHLEMGWLVGATVVSCWRSPECRVEEQAYESP